MQQQRTPCQLIYMLTMTRELNKPNLPYSPHDQMCCQPPRCHRHVAEPLLHIAIVYFAKYSVLNY
jgi:hypothetical protein